MGLSTFNTHTTDNSGVVQIFKLFESEFSNNLANHRKKGKNTGHNNKTHKDNKIVTKTNTANKIRYI